MEIRHRLARAVRTVRAEHHVSQAQLARILGLSQSRVARIEAGDRSVSLDLMVRALLGLGLAHQELGRWLGAKSATQLRPKCRNVGNRAAPTAFLGALGGGVADAGPDGAGSCPNAGTSHCGHLSTTMVSSSKRVN